MIKYLLLINIILLSFCTKSQNADTTLSSKKKILEVEKSKIYTKIAKSYRKDNKLDSAIYFYRKALHTDISEIEKSNIYEDIGMTFFYKNDFLNTLDNFKQSLYYAKEVNNDSLIARRYSDIGVVYDYLGAYDKSSENYYKALVIFEKENDLLAVAKIYNNLGIINQNRGKKKDALVFYQKSLKIKQKAKVKPSLIASTYVNIGSVYEDLNDKTNSLIFYNKALKTFQKKENKKYISLVLGNIASVKLKTGEFDSASYYINKAIELNKSINNKLGLVINYNIKAKIFSQKKQVDSSIIYNIKALSLTDTLNVLFEKSKVLTGLINSFKEKKDYKSAILFSEKLSIVEDSLNSKDVNEKIETLKVIYETDKKDKEILTLQENVNKNRILLFIISIVLLLISFIIYLFLKQKLAKSKYEANLFNQKLLRLQMNPHFIFNVLASIQSYMFEKDVKKAAIYLSSFSKLTRSILNNSREEFISLQEDIDTIENYLKIQQMRFENKFTYEIIIDNSIETENVQVPPMLIQPFAENAVVHGFKDIDYDGYLKIEYTQDKDFIKLAITDNGKGILKHKSKKHKSHALNITKERLNILNKKHKVSFQVINLNDKGVKVIFSIPLITQKNKYV